MVSKHKTENHFELILIWFGMKDKKFWQKSQIPWKFENTLMANFLLLLASAFYLHVPFLSLSNGKIEAPVWWKKYQ